MNKKLVSDLILSLKIFIDKKRERTCKRKWLKKLYFDFQRDISIPF